MQRLLVIKVNEGSRAEQYGLSVGDILLQYNNIELTNEAALSLAASNASEEKFKLKYANKCGEHQLLIPVGRLGIDVDAIEYDSKNHFANEVRDDNIKSIKVITVGQLPPVARYKLIDMISFQSTLGTGFFSEFGSDVSNIFGTESKAMNSKIAKSQEKVKDVMRALAYELGANAIIGADFNFSKNTKDATTVAGSGTAVYIENIQEVFV